MSGPCTFVTSRRLPSVRHALVSRDTAVRAGLRAPLTVRALIGGRLHHGGTRHAFEGARAAVGVLRRAPKASRARVCWRQCDGWTRHAFESGDTSRRVLRLAYGAVGAKPRRRSSNGWTRPCIVRRVVGRRCSARRTRRVVGRLVFRARDAQQGRCKRDESERRTQGLRIHDYLRGRAAHRAADDPYFSGSSSFRDRIDLGRECSFLVTYWHSNRRRQSPSYTPVRALPASQKSAGGAAIAGHDRQHPRSSTGVPEAAQSVLAVVDHRPPGQAARLEHVPSRVAHVSSQTNPTTQPARSRVGAGAPASHEGSTGGGAQPSSERLAASGSGVASVHSPPSQPSTRSPRIASSQAEMAIVNSGARLSSTPAPCRRWRARRASRRDSNVRMLTPSCTPTARGRRRVPVGGFGRRHRPSP